MIRRPPRSTRVRSSAASDVYKRQVDGWHLTVDSDGTGTLEPLGLTLDSQPVSYTHLRAHETPEQLVCRRLREKKKNGENMNLIQIFEQTKLTIKKYEVFCL